MQSHTSYLASYVAAFLISVLFPLRGKQWQANGVSLPDQQARQQNSCNSALPIWEPGTRLQLAGYPDWCTMEQIFKQLEIT